MRYLKLFEGFNDDIEFEFFAVIPKFEKAIIKTIEIHEKYYYSDVKISVSSDFKSELKEFINTSVNGKIYDISEYLELIKKYESKLYNQNLFRLNDEDCYESLGDIFDGIVGLFNKIIKNKDIDDIQRFEENLDNILNGIEKDWVYQKSEDEDDIGFDDSDPNGLEYFIDEIEGYIGKKIEDFEYGDRLQAYKHVQESEWVKDLLDSDVKDDVDYAKEFLDQIKDLLFDI